MKIEWDILGFKSLFSVQVGGMDGWVDVRIGRMDEWNVCVYLWFSFVTQSVTPAWGRGWSINSIRITKVFAREGSSLCGIKARIKWDIAAQLHKWYHCRVWWRAIKPVDSEACCWMVVESVQNLRAQLSQILMQILTLQLHTQLHFLKKDIEK